MSLETQTLSIDLVRWTFSINPEHRAEIESHLLDMGADVLVRDGSDFLVTWDEPDDDLTDVVESIWSLNGEPFDIVHEAFRRTELHTIQHAEDDASQQAA